MIAQPIRLPRAIQASHMNRSDLAVLFPTKLLGHVPGNSTEGDPSTVTPAPMWGIWMDFQAPDAGLAQL